VRSNLVVVLDQSQSMGTVDSYEPDDARKLAAAAGVPQAEVSTLTRLELAKKVLANPGTNLLEDWTRDFRVTSSRSARRRRRSSPPGTRPRRTRRTPRSPRRSSGGGCRRSRPRTRHADRQAVATVCDTFRLRDETVAAWSSSPTARRTARW